MEGGDLTWEEDAPSAYLLLKPPRGLYEVWRPTGLPVSPPPGVACVFRELTTI